MTACKWIVQSVNLNLQRNSHVKSSHESEHKSEASCVATRSGNFLHLVMKPNPRLRPKNAPFYGPQTSQAIAGFRRRDGFELDGNPDADRVADLAVRRKLDQLTPNARSEAEATAF